MIIATAGWLFVPQDVYCQTETLGIFQYTPPKGWAKASKDGAVVFSDINKQTNAFCIVTLYRDSNSSGDSQRDFAGKWKDLVVTPLKGDAKPETNTQTTPDGWRATSGGSLIEMDGVKAYALLSVTSGFGKTASILTIFTDQKYFAEISAFADQVTLVKPSGSPAPAPPGQSYDPFPNRPGRNGQKPLTGTLKENITMADLAGNWDIGAGSVLTYVDSYSGDYSHTSTTFYGEQYVIKADGSFTYKFTGRANNITVREADSGNVILSGGFITFKFKERAIRRFQFISFMTQPNGASILSLSATKEGSQGMDPAAIDQLCSHGSGYIHCVGGEEWARLGGGPPSK